MHNLGETIRIIPGQKIQISKGLKIHHTGYGHRIGGTDADSFFELELSTEREASSFRVYITPRGLTPAKIEWKDWVLNLLKCENQGPPHDKNAAVELVVTAKEK